MFRIIEQRKQKEIEYYDKEAKGLSEDKIKEAGSKGGFSLFCLEAIIFCGIFWKKKAKIENFRLWMRSWHSPGLVG